MRGGFEVDALDGGVGVDVANYFKSSDGVFVDLLSNLARFGDAEGDTFAGVENLEGSTFFDTLFGDGFGNRLFGALGNNTLDGRGGGDNLTRGGDGDDVYFVGEAGDVVDESGACDIVETGNESWRFKNRA